MWSCFGDGRRVVSSYARAVRSMEVARQARGRGLATRLCVAVTTLVVFGACNTAQAAEVPLLTGATGPTGPAGPAGPAGERGPTGPAGSGGGGSGEATSFGKYTGTGSTGGLASGKQESGTWSATIHAAAGTAQEQAQGVASV